MLAIKPTRREIIKIVTDEIMTRKKAEIAKQNEMYRKALDGASAADQEVYTIARDYASKMYEGLVSKISQLVSAEFPNTKVSLYVDLEKRAQGARQRYNPDGKVTISLCVSSPQKEYDGIPNRIREQMGDAANESIDLFRTAYEEKKALDQMHTKFNRFLSHDGQAAAYQEILTSVMPTLGDEAVPHLDALIVMIENALSKKE